MKTRIIIEMIVIALLIAVGTPLFYILGKNHGQDMAQTITGQKMETEENEDTGN